MKFKRFICVAVVTVISLVVLGLIIDDTLEDRVNKKLNDYQDSLSILRQEFVNLAALASPEVWQVKSRGKFKFCEVAYDLTDWSFRERLQDELWRMYDRRGWLCLQFQRLGRYRPLIESELNKQSLPRDLVYLFVWESGLDPQAKSWANAVGIPQFIKMAAKEFRLAVNSFYDERKDPKKSVKAACQYLKMLYAYFKDWPLALASYNHGQNAIKKKLASQQVSDYTDLFLPTETYRYVFQIMAVRYAVELGIMGDMSWLILHNPLPESKNEVIRISNSITIAGLSKKFNTDFYIFRLLNPHLPPRLQPGKYPINLLAKPG